MQHAHLRCCKPYLLEKAAKADGSKGALEQFLAPKSIQVQPAQVEEQSPGDWVEVNTEPPAIEAVPDAPDAPVAQDMPKTPTVDCTPEEGTKRKRLAIEPEWWNNLYVI